MEAHTSTMIATSDREVWFFVKDKKYDNVNNAPAFLGRFLNNLHFAKGFNIEATWKIDKRNICQIFVVTLIIGSQVKGNKRSLRNYSLQGPIPDFSRIPHLAYLVQDCFKDSSRLFVTGSTDFCFDLSFNQLNESIPTNKLSDNITTIDLSNNKLTGTIPSNFSGLPRLQKL
ncbi:putative LRR receptor-like serine/threonine-protein kinase [Glycine max]|nr:putative LRR receptor-like serine/threonine-protein kinase [Glycine max]